MPLWHSQFFPIFLQQTPHISPVKVRFGVFFVSSDSDNAYRWLGAKMQYLQWINNGEARDVYSSSPC